jgi:hypothetical protein
LVVFIALAMMSVSAHAADASADSAVKAQLVERTQKLLDAIAPGDKAPWAKAMAEECLYSDENGTTMTKAKFLEELGPLPAGYSGNIKLEKPQFVLAGDTAILAYELNEEETVFGQELHARYHATDTWVRRDGAWRMIASQVVRYGGDPPAATLAPEPLRDYVGVMNWRRAFSTRCRSTADRSGREDRTQEGRLDTGDERCLFPRVAPGGAFRARC